MSCEAPPLVLYLDLWPAAGHLLPTERNSHRGKQRLHPDQLAAIDALVKVYPRGLGIEDAGVRAVFDSLILRDTGLVKCVEWDESPSGDAYVLEDAAAEAFRAEAEESAAAAQNN